MALTMWQLVDLVRDKFYLKVLASPSNMDHIVTWVHMTEDASIASFFWGNELVVTSGYAMRTPDELQHFIEVLIEQRCAGIVINIGQHLTEVPRSVIEYCQEQQFPLLTMPWDMYITEFVRDCCSLINKSNRDEDDLAEAAMHIINAPQASGADQERLNEVFQAENGFQLLAVRAEFSGPFRNVMDHRSNLRLHTAVRPFNIPYLIFRQEKRFFVLMNRKDRQLADDVARHILEMTHETFPLLPVCVGIGEPVDSYEQLVDSFHSAVSACRRAAFQKLDVVRFKDMGFYKLLYSVPDDKLLYNYYEEIMGPLLKHDKKYNTVYTETLFRYLLSDGSLQKVSTAMFTHRNTVNYRMGKIRDILGKSLDCQEEKLPYLLAYHVGVILRLIPDLEH